MIRDNLKKDDYITIPRLRKFCKENNIGTFSLKEDGIVKVEQFSNFSAINQDKVDIWLDEVAKEGIKYSFIKKIIRNDGMFKSELFWKDFIKNEFKSRNMLRMNEAIYSNNLSIQFIQYQMNENEVSKVKLNLGLFVYEIKKSSEGSLLTDKIIYPIFVEIDAIKNILEIRVKSKSSIRKVKQDTGIFEIKVGEKVTVESISEEVSMFLKSKLLFEEEGLDISKDMFFKSYYKLLASLTNTPQSIIDKIQSKYIEVEDFANKMFLELDLNSSKYINMAKEDLLIWLEKFLSLSEQNKNIFIEDRDGYPVKLIATDSEDTRIEEISANKEPLQTKASYFDHKKILQREQLCDGMSLAFKRNDCTYYSSEPFLAIIYYKKGFGIVKFQEYVEEGDIQNVLSRIIGNL